MNDIEKKIEALKTEFLGKLEDLQNEAEMQREQEELKPWKPENGEIYYTITCGIIDGGDFHASSYVYDGDSVDRRCVISRNCFPTEECAEQVAKKMRLLLRLEQLHDMLCPDYEPDWEDCRLKFYVYFNCEQGNWTVSGSSFCEKPCMVAFDTKGNAEKAAEILNKEMGESE